MLFDLTNDSRILREEKDIRRYYVHTYCIQRNCRVIQIKQYFLILCIKKYYPSRGFNLDFTHIA